MEKEKYPNSGKASARKEPEEEITPDPAVDNFLNRMKGDLRRPKPDQEAVEAALQAMQRLTIETDSETAMDSFAASDASGQNDCLSCGGKNPQGHRFCSTCGVPLPQLREAVPSPMTPPHAQNEVLPAGDHHYHHHYHHHYFNSERSQMSAPESRPVVSNSSAAGGGNPLKAGPSLAGTALSRNETAARKVTQDWVSACNTKHLDDLVELYLADAIVLRPNVSPVRGAASIREFFFSVLDAGLGEVELEPLRVELVGDVAYEAGRCKMLVPTATGKRREERGKYLIVMARQAGEWKIVSDCWSSDLSLGAGPEPASGKSNAQAAAPRSR